MTGYTVHTGSNEKFSAGWDRIFQGRAKKKTTAASKVAAKPPKPAAKQKSKGKKAK